MTENYYRPQALEEAVELHRKGGTYLAGGTQVNRAPLDRVLPDTVIDLRDVLVKGIIKEGTGIVIGAITTLQEIADDETVPEALRMAAGFIPTRSVRNQATIGGNIAAARPDSYLIPALFALAGVVRTNEGSISVEEYVRDKHDKLILDILIPAPVGVCIAVKESRSHLALPVVSGAVSLTADEKHQPVEACVALGCVAKQTIRLKSVEEGIVSGRLRSRDDLAESIQNAVEPRTDILGSAEFKKYINGVVMGDTVLRCLESLS